MRRIIVLLEDDEVYATGVVALLASRGEAACLWSPDLVPNISRDDVVLVSAEAAQRVLADTLGSQGVIGRRGLPQVVALVHPQDAAAARSAVRAGCSSLLSRELGAEELVGLLAAARSNGHGACPPAVLEALATRLCEPPSDLDPADREFLTRAMRQSIEATGFDLGLSRRQAQRRFRAICERYGLESHLDAAIMAALWGFGTSPEAA